MAYLEDVRETGPAEPLDSSLNQPSTRTPFRTERWGSLLIAVIALATWEVSARTAIIPALFFPPPSSILQTAFRLLSSGTLLTDVGATLSRVLVGFAVGAPPALVLGLAMGWSPRLRLIVDPFVAAVHAMPKIIMLPLLMVIFGIGATPKFLLIALSTFFPMLLNAMTGVRQISPIHFQVAKNYGATTFKLFTRVIAPGALPFVLTGMRLALNIAFLITIAIEINMEKEGLGARAWLSWQTFRIEELYVVLLAAALVGLTFTFGLERLRARMVPWKIEQTVE